MQEQLLNSDSLKEKSSYLITPNQIKLKIIKEVYLEDLDVSRVNNSRTKLTKNFSKNLIYRFEDIVFKGETLTDEARDFLESIILSAKA